MKFIQPALVVIFVVLLALGYFVFKNPNSEGTAKISYSDVTVDNLKETLDSDKEVYLLDVHTPEQTHIEGTDEFISFTEIEENMNKLPKDKDTEIIVYCRSGNMSRIASETLLELGYTNVKNLVGGAKAWVEKGYDL